MDLSTIFFTRLLDSLLDHVSVIDRDAHIVYANSSWTRFGENNGLVQNPSCFGDNYLQVCEHSADEGDQDAAKVAQGIRAVMRDEESSFSYEYPCHSQSHERWYQMIIRPFDVEENRFFVITHHDITKRKRSEQKVALLATLDSLTNIPNRRKFQEFYHQQWATHGRLESPLSLFMIDIDHFKSINDHYGHAFGDRCLQKLARLLEAQIRRPYDICARYGGEEFVILLGHSSFESARKIGLEIVSLSNKLMTFPFATADEPTRLSVSIGMVNVTPNSELEPEAVIEKADALMYASKKQGRNRLTAEALLSRSTVSSAVVASRDGYPLNILE